MNWRRRRLLLASRETILPAAIIDDCAHGTETTDTIDDSFVGSPQWDRGFGRGRPGHTRRVGDQALGEEDPAAL